jgi:predicted transcriptional regulator
MQAARILRYARRRAGLTQRQLAHKAGVPQPAVARIERGGVSPRVSTLEDLLAAAGFTLEIGPRIGGGVDRTLIRAALQRSPEDRIRVATASAKNLSTYLRSVRGPSA